ncbi:MAG: hypothetical protein QOH40_984, partial [Arthrobacter pascens]|nr:hypothetical protein [Arthrobacter pascens]
MAEVFQATNPGKGKITTGQAVNSLCLAAVGIAEGDLVLAPRPDR